MKSFRLSMFDPDSPQCGSDQPKIAVVIPCYRVKEHIAGVLEKIGPEVSLIYRVDDACPQQSGLAAQEAARGDPRFRLIRHAQNAGVGGAVVSGYRQAIEDGADIVVKVDGDGQMDPRWIPRIVAPIVEGEADYVKGNRFYYLEGLNKMPLVRLLGNAALSFLSKLSSGYWGLFDPTNGYTAIHATVLSVLPLEKLSKRYFFESDLLFRLNTVRAVVADAPMDACYNDEKSNLSVFRALVQFPVYHTSNLAKRIVYNYFLRDFNMASFNLIVGLLLVAFGFLFGATAWIRSAQSLAATPAGTVMLAALPLMLGSQLLLSFLNFDIANVPRHPIHRTLAVICASRCDTDTASVSRTIKLLKKTA